MPPRDIFPNPQQIKAITPKSERMAHSIREQMPFATRERLHLGALRGYEKRKPTSEEMLFMRKAEESVDALLHRLGSSDTPKIGMEYVRISHPLPGTKAQPLSSHEFTGYVGVFSDISLNAFDAKLLDGAREFLHTAVHEFLHAKSKNRWTIGQKTHRRVAGFSNTLGRLDSSHGGEDLLHGAMLFTGLNEAVTETLTLLACSELFASSWFQQSPYNSTQEAASFRRNLARTHNIPESAVNSLVKNSQGILGGHVTYLSEQRTLTTIIFRISEATRLPPGKIMENIQSDYIEGTMKRIKPLLHTAYGPDILRVLAVWGAEQSDTNEMLLAKYLTEPNPSLRHRHALAYIANHKPLQQKPVKKI